MYVMRNVYLVLLLVIGLTTTALPAGATGVGAPASAPTTVLSLRAGKGVGQVGITCSAAPTSFRVGSDGSYRIMDAVNKRILFFNGKTGKLERTINLASLGRPTDFAITSAGVVHVLDAQKWVVARVSMSGKLLSTFALSPKLKGKITTLSLAADNRLFGIGFDGTTESSYPLANTQEAFPVAVQESLLPGAVTVRSNSFFRTEGNDLIIRFSDEFTVAGIINVGAVSGARKFVDVNQGMEPYVSISNQGLIEVRRYAVNGNLMGKLNFDLRPYRTALRRVYVDRPGAVYTMQIGRNGLTIQRFVMTDSAGKPLPLTTRLVTTAPWSPEVLPPPGAA